MMPAKNAMEIFSVLDKSNCGECGEKTCLAFAGAVFTNRKKIDACPTLSPEDKNRFGQPATERESSQIDEFIDQLKNELIGLDYETVAARSGGEVKDGRLCVKVMGKDFRIDKKGNYSSDIHINSWILGPYLTYLVKGTGDDPVGRWISYREVKDGGRERFNLFHERCEEDLRKVADAHPDLFAYMISIFQGREVDPQYASDVSVVLLPLPKVPIMVCYWNSEDGLESKLNFYFDETVNQNLGNDGIYGLCSGLTTMFEKIACRHGFGV